MKILVSKRQQAKFLTHSDSMRESFLQVSVQQLTGLFNCLPVEKIEVLRGVLVDETIMLGDDYEAKPYVPFPQELPTCFLSLPLLRRQAWLK